MRKYLLAISLLLSSFEVKAEYKAGDIVFQTINGTNQNSYHYGLKILNSDANYTFIWTKGALGKSGSEILKAQDIKSHVLPTLNDLGNLGIVDSIYATPNRQNASTFVKLKTNSSLEYDKHRNYYFSVVCTPRALIEQSECTIFKYKVD